MASGKQPQYGAAAKTGETAPAPVKRSIFGLKKKPRKQPETLKEHALSWLKTLVSAVLVVMIVNGVVSMAVIYALWSFKVI